MLRQTNVFADLFEVGRAEGRAEGWAQGLRLTLVLVLEQRFGSLPAEVATALDTCNTEHLTALLPVAATAGSLAAFRAQLPADRT
jgi:hypothetical protein